MTSDIKTLKQLQEEHPDWCWKCGCTTIDLVHKMDPHCDTIPDVEGSPVIVALIAAKREDEARIAELTQRDPGWYDASPADAFSMLTAERQAHAATKEELWNAQETIQQQAWELGEVRQAALASQASINRPTDKQPTDDRGEEEK